MTSAYQRILALMDTLEPAELTTLLGEVARRLQGVVGTLAPEDDDSDDNVVARRYLPRLPDMIEWGLVIPMEDKLFVQGHPDHPALLLDGHRVAYGGEPMGINDWARLITGWSAINIYASVVVEREGRTLGELRREYLERHGLE